MRLPAWIVCVVLAGCATVPAPPTAPAEFLGTWEFEGEGEFGGPHVFRLDDARGDACLRGDWYRARASTSNGLEASRPVWRVEDGELDVLIHSGICDNYPMISGRIIEGRFVGRYHGFGLGWSEDHGVVRGRRRR